MTPDIIVLQVFILLLALTVHEFGHAYVADRMGDPTPRSMDRVTMNPLKHIDPFGTVIFPILLVVLKSSFIFGWAKPVPINPSFIRTRKGHLLVSFAGAVFNIALAILFGLAGRLYLLLVDKPASLDHLFLFFFYGVALNLFLAFFNLIPVPPLDGGHILADLLPEPYGRSYQRIAPFGILIILVLFQLDFFDRVLIPIVRAGLSLLLGS